MAKIVHIRLANGSLIPWDMESQPKPDCIGNQSRVGFLYNCYHHKLGRFFQETIKNGIVGTIKRIHDREIPRYDKEAYTYDDPRLKLLDEELNALIEKYVNDGDRVRKIAMLKQIKDIAMFVAGKEDIYYRSRGIPLLLELSHFMVENEEIFQLTPIEKQCLARTD